jgi:hypothetical protein
MPDSDRRPPAVLADAADLVRGWITVTTGSMLPLLRPGDAVEVVPALPQLGDVVLVGHDGQLLLHRVLRLDDRVMWLGGDATASREGPFLRRECPVAVSRRRHGQALPLAGLLWQRLQRWLLPRLPHLGHRLWARAMRGMFRHHGSGGS